MVKIRLFYFYNCNCLFYLNHNITTKTLYISILLQSYMQPKIQNLKEKINQMKQLLAELEAVTNALIEGEPMKPDDSMIPRIFVWYEIYARGGIVTKEKFHEIGKKYGYDPRGLGGFFSWDEPSIRYVGINKDQAALEEWAAKDVEKYKEWIEQNKEGYTKI